VSSPNPNFRLGPLIRASYASPTLDTTKRNEIGSILNVRLGDLNEAARAADATREVNGVVVACWLR
jgi:hypothetical protein